MPPRAAMCGKQLRKFGETLCKKERGKHIRAKYNKIYRIQLPKITPHVCRHTFCSNMAKSGMNPKTLQYIMGHADIGLTLGTYTHLKIEDAQEEFDRVMEA